MTDRHLQAARTVLPKFNLHGATLTTLHRTRNAVFRVDVPDGRRLLLRLRSLERFDDKAAAVQISWLERMGRHTEIGSPIPVRTASGRRFTHVQVGTEQWRATCLSWVPGHAPRGKSFLRPGILRSIGRSIGLMHLESQRFRPAVLASCPQLDSRFFFGAHSAVDQKGREYLSASQHDALRRAADRIRRIMRRTENSAVYAGIVHGDLEPPNWVIHLGVPRPIDFDEFGVGPFSFDLMQTLWTHAMWKDYPIYRSNLLAGYQSVRPMSDDDIRELDFYQAIPFIEWLNRASDTARDEEFQKWLGPTLKRISSLCGI